MFENSNKDIVKEIAQETMKVHCLRNIMAGFAIALTTILITIICGAGFGTVKAIITESEMNPGPGTRGTAIYGGHEVMERLREQPDVEWADIARLCMLGTPRNKEFAGNTIKFLAVNEGYYGHHYIDLISGRYPENTEEVLMSDTLAKKTGRDLTPGQKMTLNLMVQKDGQQYVQPVEVTISGFYDNPLAAIEDYEELYTVEEFPDVYNPEIGDDKSMIYTKLSDADGLSAGELEERLNTLNEAAGGFGKAYIMPTDFKMILAGSAALLLLVMASGYFLIYNIFYISVVNDIRFMGSMKTIGMTGKQIRTMLNWQITRLGIAGILAGVFAGMGLNLLVIRLMKNMDYTFSRFYRVDASGLYAVLAAIVFSMVTVAISSRKALSLASKVSPVEASRFRTTGKKKTVFAVISFALSGILFCVLFTTLVGYDTEWMVNRMHKSDFTVFQYHAGQLMDDAYEPMDASFVREVRELDFVEESCMYYRACNLNQKPDFGFYTESESPVKFEGLFREITEREFENSGYTEEDKRYLTENGRVDIGIMGAEPASLEKEAPCLNIYDGSIDTEKFASGGYLLYQPYDARFAGEDYVYDGPKAGEEITLSFYNYDLEDYVTKTFTILAVVGEKDDNYAGAMDAGVKFLLSGSDFCEIYGQSAEKMISRLDLTVKDGNEEEYQKTLESLVADSFNTQVRVKSKYETRLWEQVQKEQKLYIGIFVGLIIGFIGMANVVNTLVTGVLSRKIEFAALQSIGMTKRQMAGNIMAEGMRMVLLSLCIILPVGFPVTKALARYPLSTGFVPGLFFGSILMTAAAGIILTALVGALLTEFLNKHSVVERLREAE